MSDILKLIEMELPTATDIVKAIKDAEYRGYMKAVMDRPQGEWVEYSKLVFGDGSGFCDEYEQAWKCSECGHDDGWLEWNFCPNCGARMKGADDETN